MKWSLNGQRFHLPQTFQARILLVLLSLGILPLALVGLFTTQHNANELQRQSASELTGLARGLASELEYLLEDRLQGSQLIADLGVLYLEAGGDWETYLQNVYVNQNDYAALIYFDRFGKPVAGSPPSNYLPLAASPHFWKSASLKTQLWGEAANWISRAREVWIFTPVRGQEGEVSGILVTTVDQQSVANLLTDLLQASEDIALVFNGEGRVLLHSDREIMRRQPTYAEIGLQKFPLIGQGAIEYETPAGARTAGYASLLTFDWVALVERPTAQVVEPAVQARQLALLGLIASILLILLGALSLSRFLARPISNLVDAAHAIAGGKSGASLPEGDPAYSEIGLLIKAFEEMSRAVQEREERLRTSEARLRTVMHSIPDQLFQARSRNGVAGAGGESSNIVELHPIDSLNQLNFEPFTLETILPANIQRQAERTISAALDSKSHQMFEFFQDEEGVTTWYEMRTTPSGDDEALVILRNVTERVVVEEALRQAEQRYRTLFRSAPLMYVITRGSDDGPIVVDCNDTFLASLEYSREEVIGRPILDFYSRQGQAALLSGEYQKATYGIFQAEERQLVTRTGRVIDTLLHAMPEEDADGEIQGTRSMYVDITERKRMERRLRESEANFQSLMETAQGFVLFRLAVAPTSHPQVTFVSQNLNSILGANADEPFERWLDCLPEPERMETLSEIERCFAQGLSIDLTFQISMGHEGGQRWLRLIATPSFRDYRLAYYNGLILDVTSEETAKALTTQKLAFEEVLARISSRFVGIQDFDESVQQTLADLGVISGANRAYLFLYSNDYLYTTNTHEWCRPGTTPQIENLQNVETENFPWILGRLQRDNIVQIDSVDSLPLDAQEERLFLEEQDIQGLALVTVRSGDRLIGFMGLDDTNGGAPWTTDAVTLLRVSAEIVGSALERRTYEERIRSSLAEKNVLLKEIHHRVKNNLQIISSLLKLQAGNVQDAQALSVLEESQARVRSMALIHEKLYQSEDLAEINFGDYARELVTYLFRAYSMTTGTVHLKMQVDPVRLDINAAIPSGLIINELLSNALKHAFPNQREGTVEVSLTQNDDVIELSVSDDGVGLPAGFDFRQTSSLGLQLIDTLSIQLGGEVEVISEEGTTFRIRFHDSQAESSANPNALAVPVV